MTTPGEARGGYEKYFTGGLHTLHASSTKEEIEECYDKWADAYDRDLMSAGCVKHEPMVRVFDEAIKIAMPSKPKCQVRIMDMGSGTGLLGVELNKRGYTNVDALDVTQKMLDVSREKGVYTKFICAHLTEVRTPGIEDGDYNAIISSGVVTAAYGHIRPPAFYEMMRVISDGGVIYFNVRTKEIPDFRPSMKGLEDKGLWTLIKEEQVPHYNIEDPALPKSTTVFAFQVHH